MQVLRTFQNIPDAARGSVAVLGNFDGVHRGHQAVIGKAREQADRLGAPLSVVTFEPHPRAYFVPGAAPFRLTALPAKGRLLASLGVATVFVLAFDQSFAALSAEAFVQKVLVHGLRIRHAVAGYDFTFGFHRSGTMEQLAEYGVAGGFGVTRVEPVAVDGHVFSSTGIRELLLAGAPSQAAELLGHWWEVEGLVERGDQRGRTIGFPTANVALGDYLRPKFGVYAVRAAFAGDAAPVWHDGVANLGIRPTFGKMAPTLEVHLFDFSGDLYDQVLRVQFARFLRPEQKFAGLEALKAQIAADAAAARGLLADPRYAERHYPLNV